MQTQLLKLYQLVDVIESLKEDIITAVEQSVNKFISSKDEPEQSTLVNFDVVTANDEEYVMSFETRPVSESGICSTLVKFGDNALGLFRFDDGDFDMYGQVKPEVQDFIMTFILTELKNRKLNEFITPLLYANNIYDTTATVNAVRESANRFGVDIAVLEGDAMSTISVIKKEPYELLASTNLAISILSTHTPALLSITLIELVKAVLFGLFDKTELQFVDGE